MNQHISTQTNFACLRGQDDQLERLGMLAEKYFPDDPNTSLLKQRQFAELMAQQVASRVGVYKEWDENQHDLLRRLESQGVLQRDVAQLFHQIRRTGNDANHDLKGDHRAALNSLKMCWQLGVWFHRAFKNRTYKSGPFIPPVPPKDESGELRVELDRLAKALTEYQAAHQGAVQQLQATESQLKAARNEQSFWEHMAAEADQAKAALEQRLAEQQAVAVAQPRQDIERLVAAADVAAQAVELDEATTRKIIDQQLRDAGWEVDSEALTYSKKARPEKGHNKAIAEWQTGSGPADYVLFVSLTPMAVVEAKRKNTNVSGSLQQAQRYSRDYIMGMVGEPQPEGGPWARYKIPFVFSTNGRPYLRQLATHSGIWFRDVRQPENLARALDGWYTPDGLATLLKQDEARAFQQLATEPFEYGFPLRPYQQAAIQRVEEGLAAGRREMLVAMATGTGKTKTCIALIYRLLKVKRFKRVLFLVDRSALGEQAANAFKDTRMENLQTFADIFGIKELEDSSPDRDTAVHIATVQGMVQRTLSPSADQTPPQVDQYDCIIVDECHRGYLLDRELSDTELAFRGFEDYISKYRRVIDYFDAVKIGLTATPALHTTQIFGEPIYSYSYREAGSDGFLIDHEPPVQIKTRLSEDGIVWKTGEDVKVYDARRHEIELYKAPDEIKLVVDDFNRKVITTSFNQVVCEQLAREIDPTSRQKTLIFCVNDAHADLVVTLLKAAFQDVYGSVDDDAVVKITGNADKPLQLIRRYKNERNPTVAVTVDLLTTGIDVPEICNLVFLRRVNSRILFEQMLGRATRLCEVIGKETFRIFDAVRMYEAIQDLTTMQPVVTDPKISFAQMATELAGVQNDAQRELVRDQFIAKLQRKKRHLSETSTRDFETVAGMRPDDFVAHLRQMPLSGIAEWFTENSELGEILDRQGDGLRKPIFISEHADALHSIEHGFGQGVRPADYLQSFAEFVRDHKEAIPALVTVLTRPRELTRKALRELMLALGQAGFSETNLDTAWREMTNQAMAARIIGYIRQAALNELLVPYETRVDAALRGMLSQRYWTKPQQDWLKVIAAQTKTNLVIDADTLDDPNLLFKRDGGGFARLNKIFEGQLAAVLAQFNGALWQESTSS